MLNKNTVNVGTPPEITQPEECYCDRMKIGVPGVSCGDCPRDYKPATPPAAPVDSHPCTTKSVVSQNADMVMVPREPTEDMIQAAADGWGLSSGGLHNAFAAALRAGIAAAPAPAVPRPDEFTCPYCFDQGAAPAVREPLTIQQYNMIPELCAIKPSLYESVVRAIERAHGIGGGGK